MFINLLSMSIMTPSHALIGILVSVPLLQYISPVDLQERELLIPFLISDKVRLGMILLIDLHGIKVQVLGRLPAQHKSHLVVRKMRREKDCYIPEE